MLAKLRAGYSKRAKETQFVIAFLVLASVVLYLFQQNSISPHGNSELSNRPIGIVNLAEVDIRQRPAEEDDWFRAETGGDVIAGDAVYSGVRSRAVVRLINGAEVNLADEVLVIFQDLDRILVSDGSRGTVQLKLNGAMRVSFSGKLTEFQGENTELVFRLSENESAPVQLEVVTGRARVVSSRGAKDLAAGQKESIEKGSERSAANLLQALRLASAPSSSISKVRLSGSGDNITSPRSSFSDAQPAMDQKSGEDPTTPIMPSPAVEAEQAPPPAAAEVQKTVAIPTPIPQDESHFHVYRVSEIYQKIGPSRLIPKAAPHFARAKLKLGIAKSDPPQSDSGDAPRPVYFQISKSEDFSKLWVEAIGDSDGIVHAAWPLGESFWRASYDRMNWSNPVRINLTAGLDRSRLPMIQLKSSTLELDPVPSKRAKARQPEVKAKLRFSEKSEKARSIAWILHASASSDFPPEKTKSLILPKPMVDVPIKKSGRYFFRVQSVDARGAVSAFSPVAELRVRPAIRPQTAPSVPLRLAEDVRTQELKSREIAAIEESKKFEEARLKEQRAEEARRRAEERATAIRLEKERVDKMMEKLLKRERHYYVGLEGGIMGSFFDESQSASTGPTSSQLLGIKAGFDSGRSAIRMDVRQDPTSPKSNLSGSDVGASRFDIRYESWYRFEENIFNRPMRYGFLGGYSHYRIRRSNEVTQPFDLMKFGLALEIEIWNRWRTGGDFVFGKWIDSNQTFEVNGFMNYSFTNYFDLGVGYRMNMYDGGTQSDAGLGVPYRGIVGEAYSGFRYSF